MGLLRRAAPEARLDPVRFRRPGRAAMLRSGTVAVLLAVAGALAWAGPSPCRAPDDVRAGTAATASRTGGPVSGPAVAPRPGGGSAVPAGRVGVALRLADPAALALVAPGSRVDVLRVGGSGRTARVAGAALVLGVTDADDFRTAGLLVALTPAEADRAVADPGRGFAVLLHPS